MKETKHNPDQVNELTMHILGFVKDLSGGQWWSSVVLKYVPGAKDKVVGKCVDFMVKCIHEYKALEERKDRYTFEQWQVHTALMKELDYSLNKLFWGTYNEDRSCLDAEHWVAMQGVAVELLSMIDYIRGEFNDGKA